eukprot:TRINITY_DN17717_c0_g1_i1.p1 TRINITY_DN17717_c0_g1~~TRINITY_DN17717_c0_g1_i1.p1  ORF type:complete len:131 (-),score=16.43 TRINITY_DN17717_c0_g1_i1:34-426(-)
MSEFPSDAQVKGVIVDLFQQNQTLTTPTVVNYLKRQNHICASQQANTRTAVNRVFTHNPYDFFRLNPGEGNPTYRYIPQQPAPAVTTGFIPAAIEGSSTYVPRITEAAASPISLACSPQITELDWSEHCS